MEFRKYMVCDPFSGPIFSEHSLFLGGSLGPKTSFCTGAPSRVCILDFLGPNVGVLFPPV